MAVVISAVRPDHPDAAALIADLEAELAAQYAIESRHGYAVEKLIERGVLEPDALPLMRHIYAVAAKGRPVESIFERFFQPAFLKLQSVTALPQ
jgi:hypothetical protein